MKIECEVCGKAEGEVLCCADEAVVCSSCDEKIHAVNKLSKRHHRLSLLKQHHQLPPCDLCREKKGYLFCLEDRKLVCTDCDGCIHNNSPYASAHQRFLIAGLKLALYPSPAIPSTTSTHPLSSSSSSSSSSATLLTSTTPSFPQPTSYHHHDRQYHHYDELVQYHWPQELDFNFSDMDDSSNVSTSSHYN